MATSNTVSATPETPDETGRDLIPSVVSVSGVIAELDTMLGLTAQHAAALEEIGSAADMRSAISSAMSLYREGAGEEAVRAGEALVAAGKAARDAHTDYRVGVVGATISREPAISDKDLAESMFGPGSYKGSVKVMVLRDRAQVEILAAVARYNTSHKTDEGATRISLPEARKAIRGMNKTERARLVKAIDTTGAAAVTAAQPVKPEADQPVKPEVAIRQAETLLKSLANLADTDKAQADVLTALLVKIGKASVTRAKSA